MNDEEKNITLTESQLEKIIQSAVINAMRELKEEEKLPGNEIDERDAEPEVFDLLENTATQILGVVILLSIVMIVAGFIAFVKYQLNILYVSLCFDFGIVGWYSFRAIRVLHKTKRIEVLNTMFSAIMALATLTVAVISAVIAYKAL